jgi:ABC-type transporter Mla subunit MlaD
LKKEIKIGLTIIGGIVLLYLSVAWVKGLHLFSANRDSATILFKDLAGLKEGDPVAVFGYPCGNVEEINITGDGAKVEISFEKNVQLKIDASAEIRVKELMGSKQISLEPGHASEPLGDRSIIGTTSLDFSAAMSKAGEFMERFDAAQVDSLVTNINKAASAFARMGEQMDSLDTRHLVNDISSSAASLSRILTDVERRKMVDQIDRSLGKVDQLAAKAEKTMGNVDELTAHLTNKTLPNADEMLGKVNKMLDDTEGMVNDLKAILEQMQDKNTIAGQILYDPGMAKQLDQTLDNLNLTLDHIRTKKIYVTMTLSKGQKVFSEEPIEVNGEKVEQK